MFHRLQMLRLHILPAIFISVTYALPGSIWHVSIFEGPAPSPEDGPPLAASALRDPSYLPVQIGSIVGAYIFFVILVTVALLFVGRRLRRAAQGSPRTLAMEMMKPFNSDYPQSFDPSPITPATTNPYGPSPNSAVDMKNSWPSPKTKSGSTWSFGRGHKKQTSMQSSVVTFDESVIEEDKTKNQQEMDRLYAAVMEHDEQKSTSRVDLAGQTTGQHPPELQHLRQDPATQQFSSFPARSDTKSPTPNTTASPRKQARPSPISTVSRASSRSSIGSFGKKRGIRNLPISPPMGSPDLVPEHISAYGESEPLSPRIYQPGPPPPTPPAHQYDNAPRNQHENSRLSPKHAGFPNFHRTPRTAVPTSQGFSEPPSRPELQASKSDNNIPLRELSKQKRAPTPLALRTGTSINTNTHQLPLRSAPLPLRNPNPTASRPVSTIKATVLERSLPDSVPGPRTGVPSTPYSPYMPFTPLTPMTPSRLVTKQERKRREKEEGRRVVTVEDAVLEESDMWGSAYP